MTSRDSNHAHHYSRIHSLCITRCELLMFGLQQAELAEFRSYLGQLPQLRRVENFFGQATFFRDSRGSDIQDRSQQLMQLKRFIVPDNVDFVPTIITDSIRHDAAAYLGMMAYALSSTEAGALFIKTYAARRASPDILTAFFSEGRLPTMVHEASSHRSQTSPEILYWQRDALHKVSTKKDHRLK